LSAETDCRKQIAAQLRACGVTPGGVVLVHSSLKALGPVPGGPRTVIAGLQDALGPAGTLLMPALSYVSVTPAQPVFDVTKTPSNVGAIAEQFRTMPGVRRSAHPTHSVCGIGRQADALLAHHCQDTSPCGPHSPFTLLPKYNGTILFLGCGLQPNTSMHAVEELVEPPYLFGAVVRYRIIHPDGHETFMDVRTHNFAGWSQAYERVAKLLTNDELRCSRVLEATVYLMQSAALWLKAVAALRQDPFFFVTRQSSAASA
jgi:aminoglycoside 3-N-acetyltransferase